MKFMALRGMPSLHQVGWLGMAAWSLSVLLGLGLMQRTIELREHAAPAADDPTSWYLEQAGRIELMVAELPDARGREGLVSQVLDAAADSGLEVTGGRYREEHLDAGRLRRLDTTLPVTGDSLAVLRWVDRVITELPAASFVSVSLRRSDTQDVFVGDIRLDLFMRGAN